MALLEWLLGIAAAGFELVIVLALAVFTTISATSLFDRLTQGIEEWKEIKKGNAAVGLLLFSVVLAIAWINEPVVLQLQYLLAPGLPPLLLLAFVLVGLLHIVISTLLGIFTTYIAVRVFDRVTSDVHEMNELKRGNVALALVLAGLIFVIALLSRGAILELLDRIGLYQWALASIG